MARRPATAPRTGTLETRKDARGRAYYRGRVRLQHGSLEPVDILRNGAARELGLKHGGLPELDGEGRLDLRGVPKDRLLVARQKNIAPRRNRLSHVLGVPLVETKATQLAVNPFILDVGNDRIDDHRSVRALDIRETEHPLVSSDLFDRARVPKKVRTHAWISRRVDLASDHGRRDDLRFACQHSIPQRHHCALLLRMGREVDFKQVCVDVDPDHAAKTSAETRPEADRGGA